MRPALEVIIYTPQELNQSSYIRAGLFDLQKKGVVHCKVKLNGAKRIGRIDTHSGSAVYTRHRQPKSSVYKVIDHANKKEISFAVDLYDSPWYYSDYALHHCAYIFKRNFVKKYVEPLSPEARQKVHPLGLSFMVQSDFKKHDYVFLAGLWLSNVRHTLKLDRMVYQRAKNSIVDNFHHWQRATNSRTVKQFEAVSDNKLERVLFQTRCFPRPEESDANAIHQERADLIRYLRTKLNGNFIGGFIPDPVSRQYFPDCLTNLPTNPQEYLQMVKESAIGIYTRGLGYSPAWKMAEYLAQGMCIVAEPLTTELPAPLENGKHVVYFNSLDECAELCKMLLKDPERRKLLSANARKYYEQHVSPSANVFRMLQIILNGN